jgi:Domain of unknown function (DUF4157)
MGGMILQTECGPLLRATSYVKRLHQPVMRPAIDPPRIVCKLLLLLSLIEVHHAWRIALGSWYSHPDHYPAVSLPRDLTPSVMAAGHPEQPSGVTRRRAAIWAICLLAAAVAGPATPARAHGVYAPVDQVVVQDMRGLGAQLLAQWITASRQESLAAGTKPIPPQIIEGLVGFFPDALLHEVRFRTGQIADLSLPALAFRFGDATAVTLGDVVVFNHEADAQTDLKLWAHELTHVMQYRRWGIDGFAARYVEDSNAVEREAYGNADRFVIWRSSGRR